MSLGNNGVFRSLQDAPRIIFKDVSQIILTPYHTSTTKKDPRFQAISTNMKQREVNFCTYWRLDHKGTLQGSVIVLSVRRSFLTKHIVMAW